MATAAMDVGASAPVNVTTTLSYASMTSKGKRNLQYCNDTLM